MGVSTSLRQFASLFYRVCAPSRVPYGLDIGGGGAAALARYGLGNVNLVLVFATRIVGATLVVAQGRHKAAPTTERRDLSPPLPGSVLGLDR